MFYFRFVLVAIYSAFMRNIAFMRLFFDVFEVSSAKLTARALYVVSKTSAYCRRHTEFFEFMQKFFRSVNARRDVIALFDLVEPYEIDVRGKAFQEPCEFSCASVRVVFSLYERVLEYDSAPRFVEIVSCAVHELLDGIRSVYGHKRASQIVERSVQTYRKRDFVSAVGKLADFVAKPRSGQGYIALADVYSV